MGQQKSKGPSYGPYALFLLLIGIVFLLVGLCGMGPWYVEKLQTHSLTSQHITEILIWAVVTFGMLGIGSFGIRYYGVRNSIFGLGVILIVCGVVGIIVHFVGGGHSDNAIWVVMNMIGDAVGSLLFVSIMTALSGALLVVGTLVYDEYRTSNRAAE